MIRAGAGEPLILLHGVTGGPEHWREVVPLLAPHHDAIALAAIGHAGRPAPARRPATIVDAIDDIERQMDELELATAHVAGNSMGGWIALELARRGRGRSVCALSPAGTWEIGTREQTDCVRVMAAIGREERLGRPLRALMVRSRWMRRYAARMAAEHADRMARDHLLAVAHEGDQCEIMAELIGGPYRLEPLDPLPCPVTIAWSERDRILPFDVNGVRSRTLVPAATQVVLSGHGHVPMFDDPAKVARVILQATGAV